MMEIVDSIIIDTGQTDLRTLMSGPRFELMYGQWPFQTSCSSR